jgi:hypothetical protein
MKKLVPPASGPNINRFENRKQISAGKNAVEVLPTIGVERLRCRVVVYDGDVVHVWERREVFECFHPKDSICLTELRTDRQRL